MNGKRFEQKYEKCTHCDGEGYTTSLIDNETGTELPRYKLRYKKEFFDITRNKKSEQLKQKSGKDND